MAAAVLAVSRPTPHPVLTRSPHLGPTRGGHVCPGPRATAVLWGWEHQQVLRPQLDTHGLQPWKAGDRHPLPRVSMSPSGPGHCGRAGPDACLTPALRLQSVYERQGIAVMTPTVPGSPKGPCLGLPRGTMRRQKSIGKERGRPRRACPWSVPAPATPRLPARAPAERFGGPELLCPLDTKSGWPLPPCKVAV